MSKEEGVTIRAAQAGLHVERPHPRDIGIFAANTTARGGSNDARPLTHRWDAKFVPLIKRRPIIFSEMCCPNTTQAEHMFRPSLPQEQSRRHEIKPHSQVSIDQQSGMQLIAPSHFALTLVAALTAGGSAFSTVQKIFCGLNERFLGLDPRGGLA
jgi:hypothetical protein